MTVAELAVVDVEVMRSRHRDAAATLPYTHVTDFRIGGASVPASGDRRIAVVDPATGEEWGSTPVATPAEVDAAVGAARAALPEWSAWTPSDRADALRRMADAIERRSGELSVTNTLENGSPVAETAGAAANAAGILRTFADLSSWLEADDVRPFRGGAAQETVVAKDPIGVCALIAPWNFPINLVVIKLAPALVAGCTVVIKPASPTPLSIRFLLDAADEAGIPAGVINLITGDGAVGDLMVRHPDVDKVAFTGSTPVGRKIAAACGELLRPVTLELGGKSAAIVLPDADVAAIAPGLIRSSMRNTGQTCYISTRIIATPANYDEVVAMITETIGAGRVGDPLDPDTVFGPVATEAQRASVVGYLRSGVAEGARAVLGGTPEPPIPGGSYVAPTVFADVTPEMAIAREEIFGPVITVLRADDVDHAVAIANGTEFGLGGIVFGTDEDAAFAVARRIDTGSVGVNFFASNHVAPFGGRHDSGLGLEYGIEGLAAYVTPQSLPLRETPKHVRETPRCAASRTCLGVSRVLGDDTRMRACRTTVHRVVASSARQRTKGRDGYDATAQGRPRRRRSGSAAHRGRLRVRHRPEAPGRGPRRGRRRLRLRHAATALCRRCAVQLRGALRRWTAPEVLRDQPGRTSDAGRADRHLGTVRRGDVRPPPPSRVRFSPASIRCGSAAMNDTSTFPTALIAAFDTAVRAELSDLPEDEVEDLVGGLVADLTDQAHDDGASFDPGDPVHYARELRTAAGLPERTTPPKGPGAMERMNAWEADLIADFRRSRFGAWLIDAGIALRPIWWVVRALVIYFLVTTLIWPYDLRGFSLVRFLVLAVILLVSMQWGRGRWLPKNGWRHLRTAANVVGVLALIPALSIWASPETVYVDSGSSTDGLLYDGDQIGNIFAYDENGALIDHVLLYTDRGKPLNLYGKHSADEKTRIQPNDEGIIVPTRDLLNKAIWNSYPLPVAPMTTNGEAKASQVEAPKPPFLRVPSQATGSDPTNAPEPSATPTSTPDPSASPHPSASPDPTPPTSASPAPSPSAT